jgi:hypothetical protein
MRLDRKNPFQKWFPKYENSMLGKERGNRYGRIWMWCFIAHFFFFLIPDSIWGHMEINLSLTYSVPDFIWTIIRKSSFPISAYVFWVTLPFFIILESCVLVIGVWPFLTSNHSREFELFVAERDSHENKKVINMILGCFLLIIAIVSMYVDPNPETTPIFRALKPFQNKVSFFFLYGGGAFLLPALILLPVGELRYSVFRLTHRR